MLWLDERFKGRLIEEPWSHENFGEVIITWRIDGPDDRSPFPDHRYRWHPWWIEFDFFTPEREREWLLRELHTLGTHKGSVPRLPYVKGLTRYDPFWCPWDTALYALRWCERCGHRSLLSGVREAHNGDAKLYWGENLCDCLQGSADVGQAGYHGDRTNPGAGA